MKRQRSTNPPSKGWCLVILIALSMVAAPRSAFAQPTKESHWGVSASFSPQWTSNEKFQELLLIEGDELTGKEFTVGVVRGSTLGGEWGVSYVRKSFDDAVITDTEQDCFGTDCFSSTTTTALRSVYFRGVEFHAAIPFVTIKRRVQLGIVVGGGIAVPEGDAVQTYTSTSSFRNPVTGATITSTSTDSFQSPIDEVFFSMQPLGKVEAQGSVIVAPGFKVRFSGGLNVPGVGMRVSAVYLFGK